MRKFLCFCIVVAFFALTHPEFGGASGLKVGEAADMPLTTLLQAPTFTAPVRKTVLENGLTILAKEDPASETVTLELLVKVGQAYESERVSGVTVFLQSVLMEEKKKDGSLRDLESVGGLLSFSGTPDFSEFYANVPSGFFHAGAKALSALLHPPSFDPQLIEKVRTDLKERVRREKNSSYSALYQIFLREFYTFHPYRLPEIGSERSLERISGEDMRNFFSKFFVPNNMILSIVGNVNPESALQIATELLKDLKKSEVPSPGVYFEPDLKEKKEIHLNSDAEISWIFMGFPAPPARSQDYEAMQIIHHLLGSSMSSRIWMELREKRGLAYQLGSQYPIRAGPSHFIINVATRPQSFQESKRELLKQIQQIQYQPVPPEELKTAKRKIIGQFLIDLESNRAQASFMAWAEGLGKGYDYEKEYPRRILNITEEQVQRVAKKYLGNYVLLLAQ